MMPKRIVIIGSGNVATHFSTVLKNAGYEIVQVFSRNLHHAVSLSEKLDCSAIDNISNLNEEADVYLFAVSDSAIETVLRSYDFKDKLLVHTAGSVSLDIFKPYSARFGVIYPLQTFSKDHNVNFKDVPLFIEASNKDDEAILLEISQSISDSVILTNSEERKIIHLAAVFANNFSNHMFHIASELLEQNGIPFEYLRPLINETASKINSLTPAEAQTGPAVRGNEEIITKHIEMLDKNPDWQKIYTFVSGNIMKSHNK